MKDSSLRSEFSPVEPARYPQHARLLADERHATMAQHSLCMRYLHASRHILKHYSLTPLQYAGLLEIWAENGVGQFTVTELARHLDVRHNSAVVLADTLCRKGLVSRSRSSEDGRRVLLQITPEGDSLLEELIGVHRSRWDSLQAEMQKKRP